MNISPGLPSDQSPISAPCLTETPPGNLGLSNQGSGKTPLTLPAPNSSSYPANDEARTQRFIEELNGEARYVTQWEKWVIWDGAHWNIDSAGVKIVCRAMGMSKILIEEAMEIQDSGVQKKAFAAAVGAGNVNRIDAMVRLAKAHPDINAKADLFDADPWLLGVQNGVIELKTNTFRPAKFEDYVLRKMAVTYDPAATCQPWLDTLKLILPDPQVRAFVQRAVGYSLVGVTSEQVWFFPFGTGQNGKSTFAEVVLAICGDYGHKAPAKLFLRDKNGAVPEGAVAQLKGRRFVIGSEIPDDGHLAEALIKDLAGDDTLSGRLLYNNDETFTPTHTLWLYGNVRPVVKATDLGTWRRIRLIPFEVVIQNRDLDIKNKLLAVKAGIFNWMLEGSRLWQVQGLAAPPAVVVATADYRESEDVIGQFIEQECNVKVGLWARKSDIYAAFKAWSELMGTRPQYIPGINSFGRKMSRPGIIEDRLPDKNRDRIWRGLDLKDPAKWPKLA